MSNPRGSICAALALLVALAGGCQTGVGETAPRAGRGLESGDAVLASFRSAPGGAGAGTVPFVPIKADEGDGGREVTHIALLVSLNDGPPHPFILDTGTPVTAVLISRHLLSIPAVARKIDQATPARVQGISADATTAYLTKAESIAVGGCRLAPFQYLLIPTDRVEGDLGQTSHGPVLGILGNDFLSRFRVTVDYQRKTVTLEGR